MNRHRDWLLAVVESESDLTLAEIADRLLSERGVTASQSAIWRFYERNGVSYKKKTVHAAEQDRPDVALARTVWREEQHTLEPEKLVFIDETGAATDMARAYGRGPVGERVIGKVPYGHWKTTTFIAGLRCDQVIAPFVVDQPMNGRIFRIYVARCLCPVLRPDDTVIIDNLGAHRVDGVRQMIEACGAGLVYLPPYSPDLNAIEQFFSKLKALLRKAKERTVDALWNRIGTLLDVTPQECANYLRNAGYA